jgi:C4-dicarboxylate-specific signal transduction histidine kinase
MPAQHCPRYYEQKKLQNEMARLERLNIIGEMAAAIGLEIRNPMTSIRGFPANSSNKPQYSADIEYFQLMLE